MRIQNDVNRWQPIVDAEINKTELYYNYSWGINYEHDKWSKAIEEADSLTLSKSIRILSNHELGYFVYINDYSFSGDWHIISENYYDSKNKLYFILWILNTFQADEAVTVKKRIYIKNGKVFKESQSIYKLNTEEEIEVSFIDRDVDILKKFDDIEVYSIWKSKEK